jgi:hypothetical protein
MIVRVWESRACLLDCNTTYLDGFEVRSLTKVFVFREKNLLKIYGLQNRRFKSSMNVFYIVVLAIEI